MKWFRLYDEITEDPKMIQLTDQEFRVWIYLLCYMNKQTKRGFSSNYLPTILLLSGATKQRLNSINRALDKLESFDMIKRNDHSLQIVNWDKRQYKTDDVNERVKRYRNVTRNVTVTPPDTDTDTDTDKSPLNTPPRKPKNRVEYSTDFQKFWDVYPEKTGKGKAYEEWVKIKPSESLFSEIIDSVNKHIEHSQKWQSGYIPNPATFLHQRRWEDQPDGHTKVRSAVDIGIARFLAKGEDDE